MEVKTKSMIKLLISSYTIFFKVYTMYFRVYQNYLWSTFASNINPKVISCVCFAYMLPLVTCPLHILYLKLYTEHFWFHKSGHLLLMSKMKMDLAKTPGEKKDRSALKLKAYQKTHQNQEKESCWFLCTLDMLFEFLAQGNSENF